MAENQQNLTPEEKAEKAKALLNELKELELSDDDLKEIAGGYVPPEGKRCDGHCKLIDW